MSKKNGYGYAGGTEDDTIIFITPNGAWGKGEVLFVDTIHWRKSDWNDLDNAIDEDKQYIAETITKNRHKQYRQLIKELIETNAIQIKEYELDEDGVTELGDN